MRFAPRAHFTIRAPAVELSAVNTPDELIIYSYGHGLRPSGVRRSRGAPGTSVIILVD